MQQTIQPNSYLPYKSVAGALIFSIILGPIGLLYASYVAGFLLSLFGLLLLRYQTYYVLIVLWLMSAMLSVYFAERYNRKIFNAALQK